MSRRPGHCIALDISDAEKEVIGIMRAKGGFTSDPNACRSALWSLADDLGIEMPNGVFDQRQRNDNSANLQKYNEARRKPKHLRSDARRSARRRQAKQHPWQLAKQAHYAQKGYPDVPQSPEGAAPGTTHEEEAV